MKTNFEILFSNDNFILQMAPLIRKQEMNNVGLNEHVTETAYSGYTRGHTYSSSLGTQKIKFWSRKYYFCSR